MSFRHPSEGIAFEPLSVIGVVLGGLGTLAAAVYGLHLAFRTARPKEHA